VRGSGSASVEPSSRQNHRERAAVADAHLTEFHGRLHADRRRAGRRSGDEERFANRKRILDHDFVPIRVVDLDRFVEIGRIGAARGVGVVDPDGVVVVDTHGARGGPPAQVETTDPGQREIRVDRDGDRRHQ
jgi:hypothetical protein